MYRFVHSYFCHQQVLKCFFRIAVGFGHDCDHPGDGHNDLHSQDA